jgi:hypothetical protein
MSNRHIDLNERIGHVSEEVRRLTAQLAAQQEKLNRLNHLLSHDIEEFDCNRGPEADLYRAKAKEDWESCELEFAKSPRVSIIPEANAAWVQCWVYVDRPTEEEIKRLCNDIRSSES